MEPCNVTESNEDLEIYSFLYQLIGELELFLRRWVPQVLSQSSPNDGKDWLGNLNLKVWEKERFISAKKFAKRRGAESEFIHFVSFSFWRGVFHKENYTQYWTTEMYKTFKEPRNAISFDYCKKVSASITAVHRLRNRIAHYDFSTKINVDAEIRNITWLRDQFPDGIAIYPQGGIPPEGKSL